MEDLLRGGSKLCLRDPLGLRTKGDFAFCPQTWGSPQVPVLGRVPVGLLGLCFREDTGPRQSLLGVVAAYITPRLASVLQEGVQPDVRHTPREAVGA